MFSPLDLQFGKARREWIGSFLTHLLSVDTQERAEYEELVEPEEQDAEPCELREPRNHEQAREIADAERNERRAAAHSDADAVRAERLRDQLVGLVSFLKRPVESVD